jgi:hypothetical protein
MTRAQRLRNARMKEAAKLRAQGWPLRWIAGNLKVGIATVHRDLKRWELEESVFHSSVPNGTPSVPNGTEKRNTDQAPNVIPLRPKARP